MEKYELLPQQLLHRGLVREEQFFHPHKLSEEDLLRTHTKGYWSKLQNLQLTRKEERDIGFPVRRDLIERGLHIAQGTLDCAKYAMDHGVSLNVAGGTHHAYRDRGGGFCVLNDIAIACEALLARKVVQRILIVDLDVHQGNGTAAIFGSTESVFTMSFHGERNYPLRKENSDLDIGFKDGTTDSTYLDELEDRLSYVLEVHKPDLLFYLAGVDVLEEDKLGRLSLTMNGCLKRDKVVFNYAKQLAIPVAVTMGGGYPTKLATLLNAHANTFAAAIELYG